MSTYEIRSGVTSSRQVVTAGPTKEMNRVDSAHTQGVRRTRGDDEAARVADRARTMARTGILYRRRFAATALLEPCRQAARMPPRVRKRHGDLDRGGQALGPDAGERRCRRPARPTRQQARRQPAPMSRPTCEWQAIRASRGPGRCSRSFQTSCLPHSPRPSNKSSMASCGFKGVSGNQGGRDLGIWDNPARLIPLYLE